MRNFLIAIIVLFIGNFSFADDLQSTSTNNPVMIIRLNKENIHYIDDLKSVVSKAKSIKNDVKFIVTSAAKFNSNTKSAEKLKEIAKTNGIKIANDIAKLGVNKENIKLIVTQKNIETSEIYIEVE